MFRRRGEAGGGAVLAAWGRGAGGGAGGGDVARERDERAPGDLHAARHPPRRRHPPALPRHAAGRQLDGAGGAATAHLRLPSVASHRSSQS